LCHAHTHSFQPCIVPISARNLKEHLRGLWAVMRKPNAGGEPRPIAGATQERKLLDVDSTAGFGGGCWSLCVLWGKVDFDG